MKIWQKFSLVLGGSSLLLGMISLLTVKIDTQIESRTKEVLHGMVQENKAASKMFKSIQSIQDLNVNILLESKKKSDQFLTIQEYQRQVQLNLNRLEKEIITAKEITNNQKKIIQDLRIDPLKKQEKIEDENEDIETLNNLIKMVKSYRKNWNAYLEFGLQKQDENTVIYLRESRIKISQDILPLVENYYQSSIEEIVESQLHNQELAGQSISTIKIFIMLSLAISLILFVYLYNSVYPAIKQLKLATFELGLNFLEYHPIQPKNDRDELGEITLYFNQTIEELKEKIVSKSYLNSIINSIGQSIIVMDNKNNIEKVNDNLTELLGYSESELIGQSINLILSKSNNLKIDDLIELDDTYESCLVIDLMTKANMKIAVKAYFSDLLDSEGKKKGTICLAIESDRVYLKNDALRKTKEKAKNRGFSLDVGSQTYLL